MDSFSFGVVLWELITKEQTHRGNWRPVRVPEECPAEVEFLLKVRSDCTSGPASESPPCANPGPGLRSDPVLPRTAIWMRTGSDVCHAPRP